MAQGAFYATDEELVDEAVYIDEEGVREGRLSQCSRNARPEKALVGRAHVRITDPPSLQKWMKEGYGSPVECEGDERGSGQVTFLLAERAHSESARSMRAGKGSLGHSLR